MTVYNVTADATTFTANAFLVPGRVTALVDVGRMPGVVEAIGALVDTVNAVVITHQDYDHVEALDAVVDAYNPIVYAYADHRHRSKAITDGDTVPIGDDDFEVIYTPGHADDHVSLVSSTTLFSGDVVVHDDDAFDGGSFGRTDGPNQSRSTLIDSLNRLLDRVPDTVEHMYAGHGGDFHGDVHHIIDTARQRANRYEPKYPEQ